MMEIRGCLSIVTCHKGFSNLNELCSSCHAVLLTSHFSQIRVPVASSPSGHVEQMGDERVPEAFILVPVAFRPQGLGPLR